MPTILLRCLAVATLVLLASTTAPLHAATQPNIIVILADDVGYGDLSCYGATQIQTPQLDALSAQGIRFTSGYASSATCTPTRYSLLTGQFAWRKKGTGILPGNAALIIDPARFTLPAMLRAAGYTTGVVGKWHLGLGAGQVDWNREISPGPREIGFDYSFLIPATGDRTPCVYVENQKVVGLDPNDPIEVSYGKKIGDDPTGREHPELLTMKPSHGHDQTIVNGVSRIGYMTGGKAARWVDEDMADTITQKAVAFIEKQQQRPFFLYFATHGIHVPRVPHGRYLGKSGMGNRGDAILELDGSVGQILACLEKQGIADNTIVLFSSDNGPVVDDGYHDRSVEQLGDHKPSGPLRGGKYSNYEGGTRVPFIIRWPAKIKPGVSDQIVSLIDLPATFAALSGQSLPSGAAPDSINVLPALVDASAPSPRTFMIEHARGLSIRKGDWKLLPAEAAGPMGKAAAGGGKKPAVKPAVKSPELYDLKGDLGETKNVAADHPEIVAELTELLGKIRGQGAGE